MSGRVIDDDAGLTRILRETRTVAVLGAKAGAGEPAFYVPAYLRARGYRVVPVNPALAGQTVLGERVVPTLADLTEPVDLIDVFRRPEYLVTHVDPRARELRGRAVVADPELEPHGPRAARQREDLARVGHEVLGAAEHAR